MHTMFDTNELPDCAVQMFATFRLSYDSLGDLRTFQKEFQMTTKIQSVHGGVCLLKKQTTRAQWYNYP